MLNKTYKYEQICKSELESPALGFVYQDINGTVQTAHVHYQELLALPIWATSLWQYQRTTKEDIPIFTFASQDIQITQLCHIEILLDPWVKDKAWWATPLGFPREQAYRLCVDATGTYLQSIYTNQLFRRC